MGIFRKKISVEECADAIIKFIAEIQSIIHNDFDEVLYVNYRGEDEIDSSEKLRRDWEVLFFVISLIFIWQDNNLNEKDRAIISGHLIINLAKICSGQGAQELNDIDSSDFYDFTKIIVERMQAYRRALSYEGSGPDLFHLAKCFLSIIWYDIPDPNNPIMFTET